MTETVQCHSGADFREPPRGFDWKRERHQVEEVLTTWQNPIVPCFRVRTTGNLTIELSYARSYNIGESGRYENMHNVEI